MVGESAFATCGVTSKAEDYMLAVSEQRTSPLLQPEKPSKFRAGAEGLMVGRRKRLPNIRLLGGVQIVGE